MPLSSPGIAARWLLFTAALGTFPHLAKADDDFTDFDWLNETQLLEMFDYENITEWNSTESDVDASLESPQDGENVDETVAESIGETVAESIVETVVESIDETVVESVGETVVESIEETVAESIGETVVESANETVAESIGETVPESVGETVAESLGKTVVETVVKAVVETVVEKSNKSSNVGFPFENKTQHRHYARVIVMVVLLHVAVVGVCIAIYSLIYCNMRTLKKLQRANAQRCLRLMNLQSQHVPNSRECPCSGCIMARQMLQDLFLQHLHEVVEC